MAKPDPIFFIETLEKRELMAAILLSGMLSNQQKGYPGIDLQVQEAINITDLLIEKLNTK